MRVSTSTRLSELYMEDLIKAATSLKQVGYVGTLEEFKQAILRGRWGVDPTSEVSDVHLVIICNGTLVHLGYIYEETAASPGSSYLDLKRTLENKAVCWYADLVKSREK